jgi:hypothetical protein
MVLYNGNAEVIGNFRALNFYKASDINIKEDIRLLIEGKRKSSTTSFVSERRHSDVFDQTLTRAVFF